MSNMKYDAIVKSGIEIVNRIEIPVELVPHDAKVGTWLTLDGFPSILLSCYCYWIISFFTNRIFEMIFSYTVQLSTKG